MFSSASDKAKLFAENFSKNSSLDNVSISLPVFPSRTNLKLHNISITPKMVEKIIMKLDLSKASVSFCILGTPPPLIKGGIGPSENWVTWGGGIIFLLERGYKPVRRG